MNKRNGVGVVVGRFQVPDLHAGHFQILNEANKHHKLFIMIGIHRSLAIPTNPLDYPTRELMLKQHFPNAAVEGILDEPTDEVWSANLDATIRKYYPVDQVTLYAGRDGFINHYKGKFKVVEVEQVSNDSGTDLRNTVGRTVKNSVDFRSGVIYSTYNQYPRVYPTVDILVTKQEFVLLAQKPNDERWRLPGGFIDTRDKSGEDAAKRELQEETGLIVESPLSYLGSFQVPDWRSTEFSKIVTFLYHAKDPIGNPKASDDLSLVQWHRLDSLKNVCFTDGHRHLVDLFLNARK